MDDVGDKGGISKSSQHELRTPQATPLSIRYTTTTEQGRHLLNTMVDPLSLDTDTFDSTPLIQ